MLLEELECMTMVFLMIHCLIFNDLEFDDEIASITSNMGAMENNLSNDVFDGQLDLMDDDDNDDNG